MIRRLLDWLRTPPLTEEFRRETDRLLLERLRIGIFLALILIPSFVPLDLIRIPEFLVTAVIIRVTGCLLLAGLLPFTYLELRGTRARWVAGAGITIMTVTILGIARLSEGANDPVYLVQAMAIVFLIMGAGLLFPADARTMASFGLVPALLQALLTADFDFLQNLPIVSSSLIAAVIAAIGAHSAFLSRLGDSEGRRAREELLQARSDLVNALSRELDARKETEDALRKSEKKYRALFEDLRDAVVIASADGTVLDVNPAGVEMFGFESKEDLLRAEARDLYDLAEEGVEVVRGKVSEDGGVKDLEIDLRSKDGRKIHALLSVSMVRNESGEVVGSRSLIRDVTEKRLMEAQLLQSQKLEAVGMLAAGVAHEINNPLTYVISDLELLREAVKSNGSGNGAAAMHERIEEALEGAERVRRIVRDLKTFARTEDEKRSAVDVNRIVEKTMSMISPEIRYRAKLRLDLGKLPSVHANEGRLSQVFLNLLINAVQSFGDDSDARNEIRVRTRAADGEVQVEIADTGRGIAPRDMEKLFDPFFTTKPVGEGSGLGLSICYNIVTSYGGKIEAESSPGSGSRFFVRLPAGEACEAPEPALGLPDRIARGEGRGKVLIVDDEPLVLSTAKLILGREHEVIGAGSGREALAVLERDDCVDVILCDLMMREGSGMELYASLRKNRPDLAGRMIFMTGGAFTESAREFLGEVRNPRIEKPFNASDLMELIQQAIVGAGAA